MSCTIVSGPSGALTVFVKFVTTMQSSILLSLFKLVLFTGLGYLFSLTPVIAGNDTETGHQPVRILIMGDSLSAAHNISIQQSWPVLFEQKILSLNPHSKVLNASISGETSAGGKNRLAELLTRFNPTHLILELGGNDGLRGYKFNQTRQNLTEMIEMSLKKEANILLVGVRLPPNLGPVYNQRFQTIYQSIAETQPVAYLPQFLQGIAADKPEYMQADGIHPTELAQPLLSERVFSAFTNRLVK